MRPSKAMRRRIFFGCLGLVLMLAVLCICARSVHSEAERTSYVVRAGDTLWSIAEQYCPEGMDIREWVHAVRSENGGSCVIYPGQELRILAEE